MDESAKKAAEKAVLGVAESLVGDALKALLAKYANVATVEIASSLSYNIIVLQKLSKVDGHELGSCIGFVSPEGDESYFKEYSSDVFPSGKLRVPPGEWKFVAKVVLRHRAYQGKPYVIAQGESCVKKIEAKTSREIAISVLDLDLTSRGFAVLSKRHKCTDC